MYEPDHVPSSNFIQNKKRLAHWLSIIALFGGIPFNLIGAPLSIITGKKFFYLLSLLSISFAYFVAQYARKVKNERARSFALLSFITNIIIFFILFLLFLFFKEFFSAFTS